ncbi:MAG: ABC transporter ATP-binding protein [Candidatus Latescibacteria bacterium]|nr:ABC transporter ATP-binding protein [Candidatus Latescibacterota bacterium]
MTILDINNITKTFGANTILDHISFKVNQGEKVGLIGENGSGKSTLFKMIVGIEDISGGTITKPKGIGYLAQDLVYTEGNTVYQELLGVFEPVQKLGEELKTLEAAMNDPDPDDRRLQKDLDRYGRLLEAFERLGGYAYEHRIEAILDGLRLSALRTQRVESLSGGEKNIVGLARILLEDPDLLLLDEPANHLDFEGLAWLEEFLQNYDKTVILISHNRYLLDRVVGRIVEVEDRKVAVYPGNYSAYRAQKLRNLIKQKAAYDDQQKEIRRMEEMIARWELWGGEKNIKRARSREKMLDRMDKIDRPDLDRRGIDPAFGFEAQSGRIALELRGYSRAFGDRVLFQGVDLRLSFGDRVGLLGGNGTGKTTLFKDIIEQAAWDHPVLRIGPRTRIGYYAQEHETLPFDRSILEALRWDTGLSEGAAFKVLSRFLFRWEDMGKRISSLSGGEKSRVQLARLMVSDANLLLLDEPTNHLDIHSREQVEEALEEFEGTLLVISHDRYFLDRIVDHIVEIRNPHLMEYPGNFSYFWEKRRAEQRSQAQTRKKQPVARRQERSPAEKSEQVEKKIEELEAEKLKLEQALAAAYRDRDFKRGEKVSQGLRRLEDQIEQLYEIL